MFFRVLFFVSIAFFPRLHASEIPVVVDQSHSHILFEVKTDFNGFTAELNDYKIDALADSETGKITSAQVNFPFSGIKTGDQRRDRDMLTWENDDQFPQVVCTLTRLESLGDAKYNAHGEVLFHGVRKEISFPVTVIANPNQSYIVDGDTYIDTVEYELPKMRKYLFITVNPIVHIFFHLEGSRAAR